MKAGYEDILSRLGEPLWYDYEGVPRYDSFHPNLCGVYASFVSYNQIACQSCVKKFFVAVEICNFEIPPSFKFPIPPPIGEAQKIEKVVNKLDSSNFPSPWDQIGSFHYGDPPIHRCFGDSMNSVPVRIIEFWQKGPLKDTPCWSRIPRFEFEIVNLKEEDQ